MTIMIPVPAGESFERDVLAALGVDDVASVAWPLPNAEPISPPVYWRSYTAGGATALIELGLRRVEGRTCRVFATFERGGRAFRGGVAVAVDIHSLEALFFSWSSCAHEFEAEHSRFSSRYACAKCGHAYVVELEP